MSTMFNAIYFADISRWLICPRGCHASYYFSRAFTPTLRPILKCTFSGGVVSFFLQRICTHKSLLQIDERSLLTTAFCLNGILSFSCVWRSWFCCCCSSRTVQHAPEWLLPVRWWWEVEAFVHKLCFGIETSRVVEWVYQELCAHPCRRHLAVGHIVILSHKFHYSLFNYADKGI